eukprot:m.67810 g.67810  ORF g.67810 m.67810 type:complete len:628 (-) comp7695_c1_seq1:638-2521(-)
MADGSHMCAKRLFGAGAEPASAPQVLDTSMASLNSSIDSPSETSFAMGLPADESGLMWNADLATPPHSPVHSGGLTIPTLAVEAVSPSSPSSPPAGGAWLPPASPMRIPFPGSLHLRSNQPHTPRTLVMRNRTGRTMGATPRRLPGTPEPRAGLSSTPPRLPGALHTPRARLLVEEASANTNPFTPNLKKRGVDGHASPAKRHCVANISRYQKEFIEESVLGAGEFGTVHKCRNRLDGTHYAIKKSKKPIAGLADEQSHLREVYAHAVLEVQPHIVRYYSAWEEDNHMLIQNEYCDGGSLETVIARHRIEGRAFTEQELRKILRHVALGLNAMHRQNLAHLDIKPGNIFLKTEVVGVRAETPTNKFSRQKSVAIDLPARGAPPSSSRPPLALISENAEVHEDLDCSMGDNDVFGTEASSSISGMTIASPETSPNRLQGNMYHTVYKIGDLGHVTRIDEPNVEEGDCRYLPKELLNDNYKHLPKADIFALGISIYEAATNEVLPKNGPRWHLLRDGQPPKLERYSMDMNSLVSQMLHPDPEVRPSAEDILQHPATVCDIQKPNLMKSRSELAKELNAEKAHNKELYRQLEAFKAAHAGTGEVNSDSKIPATRRRAPQRRVQRSNSVTW